MNDLYTVERVMDIITYMISERTQGASLSTFDTTPLSLQGYTNSEIAAAISWMIERSSEHSEDEGAAAGYRILHGIERDAIDPEAWGMVLTYQSLGFLVADDVEAILERVIMMSAERHVGSAEIKAIIASYVLHQQPLPQAGSRSLLLGNDSVN